MPEVELHVYGSDDDKSLKNRKGELKKNGVILKGFLEDSIDLSKYKALLAPTVSSVGLRGKIV